MKLFERLRWLPTDRLTPGTADVSGKSCVLATLVGDTPGTSSASSRKLRPLSGRLWTSACRTPCRRSGCAPPRAPSPRAFTVTVASTAADGERDRQFERRADRQRERPRRVAEAARRPRSRTGRRAGTGNRNRPSRSVTVVAVDVRLRVPRATPAAPGTTAPDGSVTRPLTTGVVNRLLRPDSSGAREQHARKRQSSQHSARNTST